MKPHPMTHYSRRWWLVAGVAGLIGVSMAWMGAWAGALPAFPLVVLAAWAARNTHRAAQVVQAHNAAYQHTLAGELDQASAMLASVEPLASSSYLARAIWSHRAFIALYRGDLEAVEQAAEHALAKPPQVSSRLIEEQQIAATLAIRALARAVHGENESALVDADAAAAYPEAGASVLGRVLLARLAVAARIGDRERLRRLVSESRKGRIVEELAPRERALYRRYRQLAYSAPAPHSGIDEVDFLRAPASIRPPAPEAADPEAIAVVLAARQKAARKLTFRKVYLGVGMWLGLLVLILTLWQMLTPRDRGPEPAPATIESLDDGTWTTSFLTWGFLLFPVCVALLRVRRTRRRERRIGLAQHAIALGDEAEARRMLEPLRKRRPPALAAQASLLLAELEYAAAHFGQAATLASEGLSRIPDGQARALHSDLLVPGLGEIRAAALAASGQIEPARAELAVLVAECPSYAFRARAEHRVGLLTAVASGDVAQARALAARRPETALALREEMLGDLISMPAPGERERIAGELAESESLARWIEAVAPGLAQRVAAAS